MRNMNNIKNKKKKIQTISLLTILLVCALFSSSALAQQIQVSEINFFSTEQNTTVSWKTETITDATFYYGIENLTNELKDMNTGNYHEFTFETKTGKSYYYNIKSCTTGHTICTEKDGTYAVDPFILDVEIPEMIKTSKITITGTTLSGTEIKLFVNDKEQKRIKTNSRDFKFNNIPLQVGENIIKITAEKDGKQKKEKTFSVKVDVKPPAIKLSTPLITKESTLKLQGNIDEAASLNIEIIQEELNISKEYDTAVEGDFTYDVDLFEGKNQINIIAEDKAGFKTKTTKEITYDAGPPQFIETNLEQLSPTYKRVITVAGKTNEKSSITVYVNGKAKETVLTDDEGNFKADVALDFADSSVSADEQEAMLTVNVGGGFTSRVKVKAIDAVGYETESNEVQVEYAVCGQGTWFKSTLSEPVPEILTPRLLLEGMQQMGLAFELEYKGNKKIKINTNGIRATAISLSPAIENRYDNGWININTLASPVKGYEDEKIQGYIQFNFNAQDLLAQDLEATTMDKLLELSDYRKGQCLIPGMGCAKFMLQLEVPFQEITTKYVMDPYTNQRVEQEFFENKVQKICIQQEIAIDQIIPADIIPSGFLKSASKALGAVVEGIDVVLKPLETVGKTATIGCIGGSLVLYALKVNEKLSCELSSASMTLTGQGFSPDLASIGMCDTYESSMTKDSCKSCQSAIESYKDAKDIYQQVCDRVACPDAPTLQTYIKQQRGNLKKAGELGLLSLPTKMPLYKGSDCAMWLKENKKETGKSMISNNDVKKIYSDYLKHKDDADKKDESNELNCAKLHPANGECCGYEYMQTWGSACGVSGIEFLDTFDEIKESACLSSERVGQNEFKIGEKNVECNKLWNSMAGLCEPEGGPTAETLKIVKFSEQKIQSLGLSEFSPEQMLYLFVIPLTEEEKSRAGIKDSNNMYSIKLGYLVEVLNFEKSDKKSAIAKADRHYLNAQLEAIEVENGDINEFFNEKVIENYYNTGKIDEQNVINFQSKICTVAGQASACIPRTKAKELYQQVLDKIGTTDKEYIVKPASGLLRSGQCICLPGIVGNLKLWKNIATAVKNCFDTILVSGEGSEGVCQAVLETYACDLAFDAINCFTESFSSVKVQERAEISGLENTFTALSTAGNDIGNDISERYGSTGLFKAMFVDRKLVHSICAFAFTGTWSLDLDALFDMSVEEIPIESSAVLYPCERRFIGYDPQSYPVKGLSKWMYHFGVAIAPGTDVDLRLKLICSQGHACKEEDGFEKGECDCKQGQRVLELTPSELAQTISKYDVTSKEIFVTLEGDESSVRYDKAELIWSWNDADGGYQEESVQCKISRQGTPPPLFCSFDVFTLSFRCVFGEQEGGIRFRNLNIYPKNEIKTEKGGITVFKKGETLNATIEISQQYETPVKPIYTRYLSWTVKDSKGNILVQKNPEDEFTGKTILKTNGDYSISTLDEGISGFEITDEWFGTGQVEYDILEWNTGDTQAKESTFMTKNDIQITKEGVLYKLPVSYVLILKLNDKNELEYEIQRPQNNKADKNGFSKIKELAKGIYKSEELKVQNEKEVSSVTVLGRFEFTDEAYPLNVVFLLPKVKLEKGKTKEIYIGQKLGTNICGSDDKTKPQKFSITFRAYDSDKYGAPTTIQSTDPATGMPVEIKKDFYAVCEVPKEVVKVEEKIDLAVLKSTLQKNVENEEKILSKLDEYLKFNKLDDDKYREAMSKNIKEYEKTLDEGITDILESIKLFNKQNSKNTIDEKLLTELEKQKKPLIGNFSIAEGMIYKSQISGVITNSAIKTYLETLKRLLTETKNIQEKIFLEMNKKIGVEVCPTDKKGYSCKSICSADEEEQNLKCADERNKCCKVVDKTEDQAIADINSKLLKFIEETENLNKTMLEFKTQLNKKDSDYGKIAEKIYDNLYKYIELNLFSFKEIVINKKNFLKDEKILNSIKSFEKYIEIEYNELNKINSEIKEKKNILKNLEEVLLSLKMIGDICIILKENLAINWDISDYFLLEKMNNELIESYLYISNYYESHLSDDSLVKYNIKRLIALLNNYKTSLDYPETIQDLQMLYDKLDNANKDEFKQNIVYILSTLELILKDNFKLLEDAKETWTYEEDETFSSIYLYLYSEFDMIKDLVLFDGNASEILAAEENFIQIMNKNNIKRYSESLLKVENCKKEQDKKECTKQILAYLINEKYAHLKELLQIG